ncbi:hypothetical protein F4861DRAFT_529272 [Xylaria intraflava]|nr:hypothetical protein F4861DRAFT_529272 [Xylaria intraflava]
MATSMPQPTPVLPPPPGVTSNFEHPVTLKRQNLIAVGIAISLTTVFFFLRVYTRIWIKRAWIFEDCKLNSSSNPRLRKLLGVVTSCGTGAAVMNHYGGRHEWDITPSQARDASYWFNAASINYGIAIGIAKISVLCLYRRVFSPVRWGLFDIVIVFLIILLALFYTSTSIVKIWECLPRDKIFDPTIPGSCVNIPMLLNVSGLFNTITDFVVLFLPVKAVWNMHLSYRKKTIVVLVFTFGLSAPIFSLVGFIVRFRGSSNPDKNWVQPEIVQWGLAELTAAMLCVCFPELGPLWKRRPRSGPTPSILNGKHWPGIISSRRKTKQGLSTTAAYNMDTFKAEPYIVLEEGSSCNIQGAPRKTENEQDREQGGKGVTVTWEIMVESASRA